MGVVDGPFGTWRGSPVEIASTWADADDSNQRYLWSLFYEYKDWQGPLDVAVGGLVHGESWQAAATGAYDERWRQSLTNMKKARAGRGTTYIRFAHEMNGYWYPWKVTGANYTDFKASWIRYRTIQKEIFPEAKLVFSANRESVGNGFDWRLSFPGTQYVDAMGVDYYNQYPWVNTQAAFDASLMQTDGYGAPKGLAQHVAFARSVGLPLTISEWSSKADDGDADRYVEMFYEYLSANAGNEPGQILYEILFNVNQDNNNWAVFPTTNQPLVADDYRRLF